MVVNQRFADLYFSNAEPIGQQIRMTSSAPGALPLPALRSAVIVAASPAGLAVTASRMRNDVRTLDADLAVYGLEPLDAAIARTRMGTRLFGTWLGVIAVIALVVASVGLAAVTAHGVAQRRQEIGIRVALGADANQVTWMFVRRTLRNLAIGLVLGLAASLAVNQLIRGTLVSVSARDPWPLVVVTVLLSAVAALAGLIPARRAARIDPAVALRAD